MVPEDTVTAALHDLEKSEPKPETQHEDAVDIEEKQPVESRQLPDLKRKLKSRHLQMIAIGMQAALPRISGTQ